MKEECLKCFKVKSLQGDGIWYTCETCGIHCEIVGITKGYYLCLGCLYVKEKNLSQTLSKSINDKYYSKKDFCENHKN